MHGMLYANFGAASFGATISAEAPHNRECSFADSGVTGAAAPTAVIVREAIVFVITGARSIKAAMISPPM